MMGELVGPAIEFAVGQRPALEHHGHGIGLCRRTSLELPMDQRSVGVGHICSIPGFQQLPALGRRQDLQPVQRRQGRLFQRLHQMLQDR